MNKRKPVIFIVSEPNHNELLQKASEMKNFSAFVRNCLMFLDESSFEGLDKIERLNHLKHKLKSDLSDSMRKYVKVEMNALKRELSINNPNDRLHDLKRKLADKTLHRSTRHRIAKKIEELETK